MFPSVFPIGDVQLVIDWLRGKEVNVTSAVGAAYNILGYALGQVLSVPRTFGDVPPVELTKAQLADCLETACKQDVPAVSQATHGALLPAWLPIALALAKFIWENFRK